MAQPKASTVEVDLRSSFKKLASSLGGDDATVQKWTETLIQQYTEPQRQYHTIDHIYSMLMCLRQVHTQVSDNQSIKLAIFFHDWIYDPTTKDNELRSIECFNAEMNLSPSIAAKVSSCIRCTIQHRMPPEHESFDLALFLDFDMEVLSRNEAEYALYARQIRQEFGHLSEKDYCAGRIKVLESFLKRDRLYFSDVFYEQKENRARENLKREIVALQRTLDLLPVLS